MMGWLCALHGVQWAMPQNISIRRCMVNPWTVLVHKFVQTRLWSDAKRFTRRTVQSVPQRPRRAST